MVSLLEMSAQTAIQTPFNPLLIVNIAIKPKY